jgi:hypothetical protein
MGCSAIKELKRLLDDKQGLEALEVLQRLPGDWTSSLKRHCGGYRQFTKMSRGKFRRHEAFPYLNIPREQRVLSVSLFDASAMPRSRKPAAKMSWGKID